MAGRVTLDDVAKRADVSKATVSAVINDKPVVKKSTRQRVLGAIEELGYQSKGINISLQGRREKSIGLVVKEGDNPFYAEISNGARSYAREHGYSLVMVISEGDYEEERRLVAMLKEHGCQGLIVSPILDAKSDLSYLFVLQQNAYPMVMLEEVRGLQTDLVNVDNVATTKEATKYFIDQGHKDIVHFAGPTYSTPSIQRVEGFRMAFSESYLKFEPQFVIPTGAHMQDGYEKALSYFRKNSRKGHPTAIVCYNDQVAIGVYRALCELDISVPNDVVIVGHDNVDLLDFFPAPICSIDAQTKQMGQTAAELLIESIEGEQAVAPRRITMDARLIIRPSSVETDGRSHAVDLLPNGH